MSVGMSRYAVEMAKRLPRIAPDLAWYLWREGENFGLDEQVRLPLAFARRRPALVHHLSLYAPLVQVAPTIVTIHDCIHLRYPEYFRRHIGWYYRTVVRRLLRRAVRIITDDRRTIDDLQHYLDVDPNKVRVIPLGVAETFLAADEASPARAPYLFYAGNHRSHKNLEMLVNAWFALPEACSSDLIFTGLDDLPVTWPRQRANGSRLRCCGMLDDAALIAMLRGATALVYPSLCEGFGLPMLEALAVGTPVIASADAVPEVVRQACTVLSSRDTAAWTTAIQAQIEHDAVSPSELLRAERLARRTLAAQYTWDRCASATADLYREAIEDRMRNVRRQV